MGVAVGPIAGEEAQALTPRIKTAKIKRVWNPRMADLKAYS
jgi:hypothetical protein